MNQQRKDFMTPGQAINIACLQLEANIAAIAATHGHSDLWASELREALAALRQLRQQVHPALLGQPVAVATKTGRRKRGSRVGRYRQLRF